MNKKTKMAFDIDMDLQAKFKHYSANNNVPMSKLLINYITDLTLPREQPRIDTKPEKTAFISCDDLHSLLREIKQELEEQGIFSNQLLVLLSSQKRDEFNAIYEKLKEKLNN